MPASNYTANMKYIWGRLAATGAKVIWRTTTPVLFQTTPVGCKYCRNESSVVLYNKLALAAVTVAAAATPSTPLRVNDLYADVTGFCGLNYARCRLQLSHGVHFTRMGRQFTGLSVAAVSTLCYVPDLSFRYTTLFGCGWLRILLYYPGCGCGWLLYHPVRQWLVAVSPCVAVVGCCITLYGSGWLLYHPVWQWLDAVSPCMAVAGCCITLCGSGWMLYHPVWQWLVVYIGPVTRVMQLYMYIL